MHDHLAEMGRNIVRLSHSNKHSRLWDSKETEDILAGNLGTEATKCIKFAIERLDLKVFLNGLRKMKELSYLYVATRTYDPHPVDNIFIPTSQTLRFMCCNCKFNEVSPYFPESLRYLKWDGYPFRYLPKTFQANNLVGLHLIYNNLVQLWEGGSRKVLYKLRFLTLIGRNLRAFDLRLTPNLEQLTLRNPLLELFYKLGVQGSNRYKR
ncbi:hypothetical protein L1887_39319 [Cichorium endivia]|nr:hypothetical protein L1887_39319 [Cichorium endivia]